jgi:serine/threonine protein kinase
VNSSSSANVHKATYHGRAVAVKALKARRVQTPDDMHKVGTQWFVFIVTYTHLIPQRLVGEVVGWAWLRHENILPFIGITTQPNRFSMVSEWIPNGDIMSFIAHSPNRNVFPLVSWPSSWDRFEF